jgi:geranylgeranyl diphosphate synthase, type II
VAFAIATVAADEIVARVRHLYFAAKVFEKADKLVDKFRAKAESLADEVEPTEFRELLYYLVDSVLEKPELPRQSVVQFVELGR